MGDADQDQNRRDDRNARATIKRSMYHLPRSGLVQWRLCRWGHSRHTVAMELLSHGVDRSVIALWLGHESVETTQMYLHADLRLKEQALSRVAPFGVKPSRYRPDNHLLSFLESL